MDVFTYMTNPFFEGNKYNHLNSEDDICLAHRGRRYHFQSDNIPFAPQRTYRITEEFTERDIEVDREVFICVRNDSHVYGEAPHYCHYCQIHSYDENRNIKDHGTQTVFKKSFVRYGVESRWLQIEEKLWSLSASI
jgi:hypothetical protein